MHGERLGNGCHLREKSSLRLRTQERISLALRRVRLIYLKATLPKPAEHRAMTRDTCLLVISLAWTSILAAALLFVLIH